MQIDEAIRRCQAGDRAAYTGVVAAHSDRLIGYLRRLLGNLDDARDVAQDTFVRAFLNLQRYDRARPFRPWLYCIARNLAYNHRRGALRRTQLAISAQQTALASFDGGGETSSPASGVVDSERREAVDAVLATMRPEFREVLLLRYMERLEYDEIADALGVPVGTVKTWLHRAKQQFRQRANDHEIL